MMAECRKSSGWYLPSSVVLVVQRSYLYPAPGCTLWLLPDALLGENFPFGCCVGGSGPPAVPSTVCHLSFGRSLGSSRDRNNLRCSSLCACRRSLIYSRPIFCHYTGHRVSVSLDMS